MPKRTTDDELLERLQKEAPEVLAAKVNLDAFVGKVLVAGAVDTGRTSKSRKRTIKTKSRKT
jgi:hypothetical protein